MNTVSIRRSCEPHRTTPLPWRLSLAGRLIAAAAACFLGLGLAAGAGPAAAQAVEAQTPADAPRQRIGLVLSGGGARGGAHIGVLKVLEEMRIPVDVIVGTSAGAIVGAAYASGLPLAEIETEMKALNTAVLVRDMARPEVPYRRKADDVLNYIGPEFGVGRDGLALPKGAVAGVSLEAVLRRLTRRQSASEFDRLPIPFRAVATDLATGDMIVLSQGSLAQAIRASMAIPGAVNPVEIEGRLLVDGGLTRNLPVDVARRMGADIVIAVNVGTPLLKREQITSFLSVSEQMLGILTQVNVNQSLKEILPDDILVTPALDDLTAADFDRLSQAALAGESATRALAPRLAALQLDEPRYVARMLSRFPTDRARATRIDEVRVTGTQRVNPEAVLASMDSRPGQAFDPAVVDADLKRIYGRGDFEAVNYTLVDENGERTVLVAEVTEKSWGPSYLRFGLGLSSDFEGNSYFNLLATHRWTWLNRLGAQWRNDAQIGRTDILRTEWVQPLTDRQRVFVAARAEYVRDPFSIFDAAGNRLARYRRLTYGLGLDVGTPIGTSGEVRLGLMRGRIKLTEDTSLIAGAVPLLNVQAAGVAGSLAFDTLDNLRFPRSGVAGEFRMFASKRALGAQDDYTRVAGTVTAATSVGAHAFTVHARAGGSLSDDRPLPEYELFTLGGFLQLSGYQTGQLLGREMSFGRLGYSYRLAGPSILDGTYLGASLELGRIGESAFGRNRTSVRRGGSLYFAFDSPLGPVYLAYGQAEGGNRAVYFFLGQP